jgi:hypothetical protein
MQLANASYRNPWQREKAVAEQARIVEQAQKTVERQVADKVAAGRQKLLNAAREEAKQGLTAKCRICATSWLIARKNWPMPTKWSWRCEKSNGI